jgi:hypothetical protein
MDRITVTMDESPFKERCKVVMLTWESSVCRTRVRGLKTALGAVRINVLLDVGEYGGWFRLEEGGSNREQ